MYRPWGIRISRKLGLIRSNKYENQTQAIERHATIFDIPPELLDLIIDFLPPASKACLALTCHSFRRYLTDNAFSSTAMDHLELSKFLSYLERHLPDHIICYYHKILHTYPPPQRLKRVVNSLSRHIPLYKKEHFKIDRKCSALRHKMPLEMFSSDLTMPMNFHSVMKNHLYGIRPRSWFPTDLAFDDRRRGFKRHVRAAIYQREIILHQMTSIKLDQKLLDRIRQSNGDILAFSKIIGITYCNSFGVCPHLQFVTEDVTSNPFGETYLRIHLRSALQFPLRRPLDVYSPQYRNVLMSQIACVVSHENAKDQASCICSHIQNCKLCCTSWKMNMEGNSMVLHSWSNVGNPLDPSDKKWWGGYFWDSQRPLDAKDREGLESPHLSWAKATKL